MQNSYDDSPSLFLIPTPIGNLEDITLRAISVLNNVEVVFSEDTRVTSLLLNHLNIKKRLISLHDHNEDTIKEKVLNYLKNGFNVGLVTDRGTPIISDPGYKTVKYVIDNNFNVISLPGPTAFVPALTISGISPQPFLFYGFLNSKDSKRREELDNLKDLTYSIIIYEAPHRIEKTLNEILDIMGNRKCALVREISKKFESVYRGTVTDVLSVINNIKGEIVLVLEGNNEVKSDYSCFSIIENVDIYIKNGMSVMDAIKKVAKERKINKSIVYNEYHGRK